MCLQLHFCMMRSGLFGMITSWYNPVLAPLCRMIPCDVIIWVLLDVSHRVACTT
jgi:hypothetical protein